MLHQWPFWDHSGNGDEMEMRNGEMVRIAKLACALWNQGYLVRPQNFPSTTTAAENGGSQGVLVLDRCPKVCAPEPILVF
jgi:hypothetical protein